MLNVGTAANGCPPEPALSLSKGAVRFGFSLQ